MTRTLPALGLVATLVGADEAAMRPFEHASLHMGTRARIVVHAPDAAGAEVATRAAFARIAEIEERLSDYLDASEVEALARAAGGEPLTIGPDLALVLQAALQYSRRSEGAFDVTCGALSHVWRRARRVNALPEPAELAAARGLVGFAGVALDPARRTARLARPGMRLDLGGIAKGYAADEALRTLRAHGLDSALVELGGEVVAGAPPPGREGWTIALPPTPPTPKAPLLLAHAAASTSGDAEQWLEVAGVRYSHVFDPRTGQALRGRRSVTVVARSGLEADALATAASVLGPRAGRDLVEGVPGAALLFVEEGRDGPIVTESRAFAGLPRAASSHPLAENTSAASPTVH